MEKPNVTYNNEIVNSQSVKVGTEDKNVSMDDDQNNPVFESLLAEGAESFYHYINWLGLGKDPSLMILSSLHHYYYDFNDLKGVKTLINLKRFNEISHHNAFLNNVFRVLPPKANFVGCFKDNKIRGGIGVPFYQSFRILNRFINMVDSKTDRFMTRKDMIKLLESHDFTLVDITELNNITFFCAQSKKKSA